jgi:hypothetical protein
VVWGACRAAILQTNKSYYLLMIQLTRLSLPSPRCFTVGRTKCASCSSYIKRHLGFETPPHFTCAAEPGVATRRMCFHACLGRLRCSLQTLAFSWSHQPLPNPSARLPPAVASTLARAPVSGGCKLWPGLALATPDIWRNTPHPLKKLPGSWASLVAAYMTFLLYMAHEPLSYNRLQPTSLIS